MNRNEIQWPALSLIIDGASSTNLEYVDSIDKILECLHSGHAFTFIVRSLNKGRINSQPMRRIQSELKCTFTYLHAIV